LSAVAVERLTKCLDDYALGNHLTPLKSTLQLRSVVWILLSMSSIKLQQLQQHGASKRCSTTGHDSSAGVTGSGYAALLLAFPLAENAAAVYPRRLLAVSSP
jgi:hypothetical protein